MPELDGAFPAPELHGSLWLNSEPLTIASLEGKPVLLSFWDYTSGPSLRAVPYVKEWHTRYAPHGLVVIGVHAPEFHFGFETENVQRAVMDLDLHYPQVLDNDLVIMNTYAARSRPSTFLVDRKGNLRYYQIGEGAYAESEAHIQRLLQEAQPDLTLPPVMTHLNDTDQPGAVSYRTTRRVDMGYEQGILGNPEGHHRDEPLVYRDPGVHAEAYPYIEGEWYAGPEQVVYTGKTGAGGMLSIRYTAKGVNLVMGPIMDPCALHVYQDGRPLAAEDAGYDLRLDEGNRPTVSVDHPRMYSLVDNRSIGTHELQLFTVSPGLALYSFTFTTSVVPALSEGKEPKLS